MDYDLTRCMVDVFSQPKSVDLLKMFPRFAVFPEFCHPVRLNHNSVIRYVVAVYDKNGLRLYEPNVPKRKAIAAHIVGWDKKNGEYDGPVKAIIDGDDPIVNRMIVRYCKMHKDPKYSALVGIEETYYNKLENMIAGGDVSKSDLDSFKMLETEIDERAIDLLNGDKSPKLKQELFDDIEYENLELRPEDIAKKIKEGKNVVDINPYGKYSVSQLRLIIQREEDRVSEGGY